MSLPPPRGPKLPLFVNLLALVVVSLIAAELINGNLQDKPRWTTCDHFAL